MNYAIRYLFHGFVWVITYLIVFALCLWGDYTILGYFGVVGFIQTLIANIAAIAVGMYWGHKLACDLVPMGPDGDYKTAIRPGNLVPPSEKVEVQRNLVP